jgi:hypothetical protein
MAIRIEGVLGAFDGEDGRIKNLFIYLTGLIPDWVSDYSAG